MSHQDSESVIFSIVRGIARAEHCDPKDLEFRLQDVIDVDALESLIEHDGSTWVIEFEAGSHLITVDNTGAISVDGRAVPPP